MGRSSEMWQDAQEQEQERGGIDTLAEELWQLGCAMNAERLAEQADMRRKEKREQF